MKKQIGARYLYKRKIRKDGTYQGIVKISNHIRLSSGAIKRSKT